METLTPSTAKFANSSLHAPSRNVDVYNLSSAIFVPLHCFKQDGIIIPQLTSHFKLLFCFLCDFCTFNGFVLLVDIRNFVAIYAFSRLGKHNLICFRKFNAALKISHGARSVRSVPFHNFF